MYVFHQVVAFAARGPGYAHNGWKEILYKRRKRRRLSHARKSVHRRREGLTSILPSTQSDADLIPKEDSGKRLYIEGKGAVDYWPTTF
jgi:hypothetical protein